MRRVRKPERAPDIHGSREAADRILRRLRDGAQLDAEPPLGAAERAAGSFHRGGVRLSLHDNLLEHTSRRASRIAYLLNDLDQSRRWIEGLEATLTNPSDPRVLSEPCLGL